MGPIHPKLYGFTAGSALGGALAVIAVWAIRLYGVDVPHEIAGAFTTVGSTVFGVLGGWLVPSPPV